MEAREPLIQSRVDAWQSLIDNGCLIGRDLCVFGRDPYSTQGPIYAVKIVPHQGGLGAGADLGPTLVITRQWYAFLHERHDEVDKFGAFYKDEDFSIYAWCAPIVADSGQVTSLSDRDHRIEILPGKGLEPQDIAGFPMTKTPNIPKWSI